MKKSALKLLLSLFAVIACVSLTSCEDDGPANYDYLSGRWHCQEYPSEYLTFYYNGNGYWEDYSYGDDMDFSYTSFGDQLTFLWMPAYAPSYYEYCNVNFLSPDIMQIWYPARDGYPPTTLTYTRVGY